VCDANLPEPLETLAMKNIPPEPLKEFLEDQGFKSLLNRMIGGSGGAEQRGATVRNDVMAALDSKAPAAPQPEKIELDRSK
jgi:DNA polymerase-1